MPNATTNLSELTSSSTTYIGRGRVPLGGHYKPPEERISECRRVTFRVPPEKEHFLEAQRKPGESDQSLMLRLMNVVQEFLE